MKALIFLLLAINTQLWAANDNNIDIKKLENQKAFIGQINQCMNSDQVERSKYAAILEELIKYNPSCFIAGINKLDNQNCKQIEELYLNEPHFYPREDLRASLKQTKDFSRSCLAS